LRLALLEDPNHVASRIAKSGCDFWGIGPDRLYDLASIRDHLIHGRGHAVHDDVNKQPGRGGRRALQHPGSAHLVDLVIESCRAVSAPADIPSEYALIELSGAGNIYGRNFDIANFAVGECRGRTGFPRLSF
jgi:hypothetical protein